MTTPIRLSDELRDAYLRYFDTAYALRDPRLLAERRALLEAPGALVADALLEPVLPYDATVPLLDVTRAAGISDSTASAVASALFGHFVEPGAPILLREHQADAVRHHFGAPEDGQNVVVTSGTGSGKTEAFLLPLLLRLVEEAATWRPQAAPDRWWKGEGTWSPLRERETRPAAVRALVLYPTNALVEDQVVRLRRAVRALGTDLPGRPLWFGRYTSATLGGVKRPRGASDKVLKEVREELKALEKEMDRLRETDLSAGSRPLLGPPPPRDDGPLGHRRVSPRRPGHQLLHAERHAHA